MTHYIRHFVHQTLIDDVHNRYYHDTTLLSLKASGQVCMYSAVTYLVVVWFLFVSYEWHET